jgi:hypothetical protein
VLGLSQDGASTNLFENFRQNRLKRDLSIGITTNPPLFSLVNTFKPPSNCNQLLYRHGESDNFGIFHTPIAYNFIAYILIS